MCRASMRVLAPPTTMSYNTAPIWDNKLGQIFVACLVFVCVYDCSTYYQAVRVGGGGDNGGLVLRETTSLVP
jgi:hypothetical protein